MVLAFAEALRLIDDGTGNFFEEIGPGRCRDAMGLPKRVGTMSRSW
jgi:hypothetical protein